MKVKKQDVGLSIKNYIPLDKSWIIRMGVLDLLHGSTRINSFLVKQKNLSDDLKALKRAARDWPRKKVIDVGESGTLYRFLQYISWKEKLNKKFIVRGTLRKRKVANNPAIVKLSISQLLKLNHGTSQWASAAVLCGAKINGTRVSAKLALTREAVQYWNACRRAKKPWQSRYDETIFRQAKTFLDILTGVRPQFVPHHSEDYCFARAFRYITPHEGTRRWPSLQGHESNRIVEMEKQLTRARAGQPVTSHDHRVVQSIAMAWQAKGKRVKFSHPKCVNKSWPQFWKFFKKVNASK